MWEAELRILETKPHKNVEEILRYSYDNLDDQDKASFLLVACFFNRYPFSHVASFLDDGLPRINHLTTKSIISKSTDGSINMHFLVVQIGRAIVCQESRNTPSRQRFLWDSKEIYDVRENNDGTAKIEGVTLHMCYMPDTLRMSNEVFNAMKSIKFLKFFQHLGDAESNVQLRQDGFNFLPYLRLLHWDAYPLKNLPSIRHRHLVELNLRYSNLERLWDKTMVQNLSNLRRLDVTGSKNLIELPDFSTAMKFEELIVEGCMKLLKTPESLSKLQFFTKLNAIHCGELRGVTFHVFSKDWSIRIASRRFSSKYLTDLSIEGRIDIEILGLHGIADHISFSSKKQIHKESEMTDQLHKEWMLMERGIRTPPTPSNSRGLQSLNIKMFRYREFNDAFMCTSFELIPSLTELKLVNLNIQNIPENIDSLLALETLDLSGNDFAYLPTSIGNLPKLKYLSLRNCRKITSLPTSYSCGDSQLSDCVNLRWFLLNRQAPNCLLELWLDNCKNVQRLSEKLSHFPD